MSDHHVGVGVVQPDLFEAEWAARSWLSQLLQDSKLYTRSDDYMKLLQFVARLRNFAPFNAMLLHVQRPGLSYAASERDWHDRFGRHPREGARPLLILRPFGPVAFVYDVLDTEGESMPEDVASFPACGAIDAFQISRFVKVCDGKGIKWQWLDAGDHKAGSIRVVRRASCEKERSSYLMQVNRNHPPASQFATLAHELGHLSLGHLGPDAYLGAPLRPGLDHSQQELEAESVAFLVCKRNGVSSKSETYLTHYVTNNMTLMDLDIYQVMRAAGRVESLLELAVP